MKPTQDLHVDITAIIGVIVLGVIGTVAVNHGAEGMTVAAGVAGGISGWLAKAASSRQTTRSEGDPPVVATTETEG